MGALLSCKMACPVVYIPSDSISLNLASRFGFVKNPFRLAYTWLENQKWARAEQVIYPKADACVVVSEQEASAIVKHWTTIESERMHVMPIGVDLAYFKQSIDNEKENHLVITGNMSPIRLVVALKWFMLNVLPIIREQIPGVTLDIVGKDPHPSIAQIAKTVGGVRVTGHVPDTRTYISEASVCIYPMLLGTGVKTNLLEAMAMSKAVVATSMCLSGLQAPINGQLAIADGKEAFASAVIELLQDPIRRKVMGNAAREFIKEYHCWDNIVNDKVENLLGGLV
jgi:glycosyltransferase involved in cell wall biosynthesis